MRQLLPQPADIDVMTAYQADARPAPPERPWLLLNMIASLDGATAVEGASGALGGPADKEVFRALRAVPDLILVAAGTVRAESYGPPRPSARVQEERAARGQAPSPRLLVVTRSLDLDVRAPLFADATPGSRPIVLTTEDADDRAVAHLAEVADIRRSGRETVDVPAALADLRREGLASVVLCEGGPSLNGALVRAGIVDELCLSLSPLLVGGLSPRLAHGDAGTTTHYDMVRILEAGGMLFLRYVRARSAAAAVNGASAPSPS